MLDILEIVRIELIPQAFSDEPTELLRGQGSGAAAVTSIKNAKNGDGSIFYAFSMILDLALTVLYRGERLPTPEEAAEQARQEQALTQRQLDQARQETDQARQRAERLAERLRALGIDPDAEG